MGRNKKTPGVPGEPVDDKIGLPGNPVYPAKEDIYSQAKRIEAPDPDDSPKQKMAGEKMAEKRNEKDFTEDVSGKDLDVPGSELDDSQENIGSEDEENNYYSLGGDDHDDLEEDKGD